MSEPWEKVIKRILTKDKNEPIFWEEFAVSKDTDPDNEKKTIWQAAFSRPCDGGRHMIGAQSGISLQTAILECLTNVGITDIADPSGSVLDLHLVHLLHYCSLIRIGKAASFYVRLLPSPSHTLRLYEGADPCEVTIRALREQCTLTV